MPHPLFTHRLCAIPLKLHSHHHPSHPFLTFLYSTTTIQRPHLKPHTHHPPKPRRPFHTSSKHHASHSTSPAFPNHYLTLESAPTSTPAQLKKQFYALSKKYHPDLHPNDAAASTRFIQLSTAWSILSDASKRAAYDRDLARIDPSAFGAHTSSNIHGNGSNHGARGGPMPAGSHSSAQAYGARPASGLSKRRGAFRGPPPSFYRQGGWGAHESKRRAAAESAQANHSGTTTGGATAGSGSESNGSGNAPGQGQAGYAGYEVPHFDREGHFRRQESVEESLKRRRSIWAAAQRDREVEMGESSGLVRLGLVVGALAFTAVVASLWDRGMRAKEARDARKRRDYLH